MTYLFSSEKFCVSFKLLPLLDPFLLSVFTPMTSLPQYLPVFTVLQLDLSDHLESDSQQ